MGDPPTTRFVAKNGSNETTKATPTSASVRTSLFRAVGRSTSTRPRKRTSPSAA
jgi:hypothetical protein